jgi:DNA-binding NarL/FixJ family response regulator
MAAISISDSLSSQPVVSPAAPDTVTAKPAGNSADTVKLSQDAQIQLLAQQGQSPTEIAQNLGIAAITVAAYLGEVPLPPPPPPEPQNGPAPAASIPALS